MKTWVFVGTIIGLTITCIWQTQRMSEYSTEVNYQEQVIYALTEEPQSPQVVYVVKDCVFNNPCTFVSVHTYQKKVRGLASMVRSLRRLNDA